MLLFLDLLNVEYCRTLYITSEIISPTKGKRHKYSGEFEIILHFKGPRTIVFFDISYNSTKNASIPARVVYINFDINCTYTQLFFKCL